MTRDNRQPGGFFGQYETRLLEDGRIRLPAEAVHQLQDGGVEEVRLGVIPGLPALAVCPGPRWEAWLGHLRGHLPVLSTPEGLRVFEAACSVCALDDQGRIYVPSRLRKHLCPGQTGHDIVVVGVLDHFEIWSLQAFDAMVRECQDSLLGSPSPENRPSGQENPQASESARSRAGEALGAGGAIGLAPAEPAPRPDAPIPSIRNHASPYARPPAVCNDESVGKRLSSNQTVRRRRRSGIAGSRDPATPPPTVTGHEVNCSKRR